MATFKGRSYRPIRIDYRLYGDTINVVNRWSEWLCDDRRLRQKKYCTQVQLAIKNFSIFAPCCSSTSDEMAKTKNPWHAKQCQGFTIL